MVRVYDATYMLGLNQNQPMILQADNRNDDAPANGNATDLLSAIRARRQSLRWYKPQYGDSRQTDLERRQRGARHFRLP